MKSRDPYLRKAGFRAWCVRDTYEESCVIVWARTIWEARQLGNRELDEGLSDWELYQLPAEPAPEFDDLKGKTLKQLQWATDWWFHCDDCGRERVMKPDDAAEINEYLGRHSRDDGTLLDDGTVLCYTCAEKRSKQ